MEDYRCKYCGGYINPRTMKCEYCDTQYKAEGNRLVPILYVERTKFTPISVVSSVEEEAFWHMDSEAIKKHVYEELAYMLGKEVMNKARIAEHYDIENFRRKYIATVRVEDDKEHVELKRMFTEDGRWPTP